MSGPQYAWKFREDKTRDMGMFEITRSTSPQPYTVLIHQYSQVGPIRLFSDIFYAKTWDENRGNDGEVSPDICFLIELWVELGLFAETGEHYHPKHIYHDPDRHPIVYRKGIEDVMAHLYGTGIVETVHTCSCNKLLCQDCSNKNV